MPKKKQNDTYDGVSEGVVGNRDGEHGAKGSDDTMKGEVEQLVLVVLGSRNLRHGLCRNEFIACTLGTYQFHPVGPVIIFCSEGHKLTLARRVKIMYLCRTIFFYLFSR
jgi:hypothetical protein